MTRTIPVTVAARIASRLGSTLGNPETSTGSLLGVWHSGMTWRFRRNDGSPWSRLGFGPTRKLVTLSHRDDQKTVARLTVQKCA